MKFSRSCWAAALALLTLGSQAFPQSKEAAQKQEKIPIPAAAPLIKAKVKCDLTLPVTGLTADNAAKVQTALEGMKAELYHCAECKAEFAKPGDCPKCKKALVASKENVLAMVTADAGKGQITLQSKEGMELRLSALERVLRTESIKVDDAKLVVPGRATLIVSGATTADQAHSIQAALKEAKLFASESAKETPTEVRIFVVASPTPPTLTRIREVVAKTDPSFKVLDVIWNDWSPPPAG